MLIDNLKSLIGISFTIILMIVLKVFLMTGDTVIYSFKKWISLLMDVKDILDLSET